MRNTPGPSARPWSASPSLSGGNVSDRLPSDVNVILDDAQKRYPASAALFESIGTIRLQQQNYAEAIRLLTQALKVQPDRIRALNNLAMSYAAIDGKAKLGIPPINRAIEISPVNAELYDTQGVVLMKAGDLAGARAAFEKALEIEDDPRFRFHLIMVLQRMGSRVEANQHIEMLDMPRLDPNALTPEERRELEKIQENSSGSPVL